MKSVDAHKQETKLQRRKDKQNRQSSQHHELHFDIRFYKNKIIAMRTERNKLKIILEYVVENLPTLDEIHLLCCVLNILHENHFNIKKKEIQAVFMNYYSRSEHGESREYLKQIYENFNVIK